MRPGRATARLALLILLSLTLLSATPSSDSTLQGGAWCLRPRVALVVFDPTGEIEASRLLPEGLVFNVTTRLPGGARLDLCYRVHVDAYQAPQWITDELRAALESLYEYPPPVWAEPGPRGAARVPLPQAYTVIASMAAAAIESGGGDPGSYHDIVVIIGDLDGYSRAYYWVRRYPYVPHGFLHIGGVKTWGGSWRVTFYDLAGAQATWPSYRVPFYDEAPPAGPETEPPIWRLQDPLEYARGLVRDHIVYHLVGGFHLVPATQELTVHVHIVDFGDEYMAERLAAEAGPGEAERLAEALAPWVDVRVEVDIINASEGLMEAYRDAPSSGGYRVLDARRVYNELSSLTSELGGGFDPEALVGEWHFYVLATPEPAYFSWDGFNFTGFSDQPFGATTYPGLDDRVYHGGLPSVIAHEVGHLLGEGHPFQAYGGIRWLMDLQGTVMSYYDDGLALPSHPYSYSVWRISLLQAITLYYTLESQGLGNETLSLIAGLIGEYNGPEALAVIKSMMGLPGGTPREPPPPPGGAWAVLAVAPGNGYIPR